MLSRCDAASSPALRLHIVKLVVISKLESSGDTQGCSSENYRICLATGFFKKTSTDLVASCKRVNSWLHYSARALGAHCYGPFLNYFLLQMCSLRN